MIERVAFVARILALGFAAAAAGLASAQVAYPTKPVRFITPFPPGGSVDPLTRMSAQKLSEKWGKPTVVENRPGGNSIIGTQAVARAAPDGYTILVAGTPQAIIDKISSEMATILAMPDIVERLVNQGLEPFISTPEQFAALLRSDMAKFAKIIKDANIKVEN